MQINIKKLDGQKEEFSLEPSDSVMKVKEMLAEKTGVHKDQIRLIFKGKPMLDDKVSTQHTAHQRSSATRAAAALTLDGRTTSTRRVVAVAALLGQQTSPSLTSQCAALPSRCRCVHRVWTSRT